MLVDESYSVFPLTGSPPPLLELEEELELLLVDVLDEDELVDELELEDELLEEELDELPLGSVPSIDCFQ